MEFTSHVSDQAKHWPSWPKLILWILCTIPLFHAVIIALLGDVRSGPAILVHQLRPIGTLGAAIMLFYVAAKSAGRHRWSWTFYGVAILLGSLFSLLRINQNISVATPLLRVLVVLIYVCALIGTALYLQQRTWWLGSTWRVIIGSITIGMGILVLLRTVLPLVFTSWAWNPAAESTLAFLAFDTGMLFALSLITIRYGHEHSRLLHFVVLGLVCLLIADSLFMLLTWMPGGAQLQMVVLPLYTLHAVLLALGAYHDLVYISTKSKSIPSTMPLTEWLLWVVVPLVVTVAAFTTTSIFGTASPAMIIALAIITLGHEVLAMFDYQRITVALHRAQLEAADVATMRERTRIAAELHDSINYYLATIAQKLTRAQKHLTTNPTIANTEILETRGLTKFALADARASIHAMRSGSIQPLERTIKELGDSSINVRVIVAGTQRYLPPEVALAGYRIAQETIANTLKHAQGATAIAFTLDYQPHGLILTSEDDGHPQVMPTESDHTKMGLIGLSDRVEQLGGTLVFGPGATGFRVRVEIPTESTHASDARLDC